MCREMSEEVKEANVMRPEVDIGNRNVVCARMEMGYIETASGHDFCCKNPFGDCFSFRRHQVLSSIFNY